MPKIIYLIRHAETDDNVNGLFQGWRDTDLNDSGLRQARRVSEHLADQHFDTIYSSVSKRASKTASEIARAQNLKVKHTDLLREHNLGKFEGWSYRNPTLSQKMLWDEFTQARSKGDFDWNKHNGESMNDFFARIKKLFNILKSKHTDQKVALVTHGGTKNRILEYLQIRSHRDDYYPFGNTSITILTKTGNSYELEMLGDTSHQESNDK